LVKKQPEPNLKYTDFELESSAADKNKTQR